jgi:GNAT superfamily N-acetyltransferase
VSRTDYVVCRASAAELPALLEVQREAFGRVAVQHGVPPEALAPMREALEDLERQLADGTVFYIAVSTAGRVIGGVRADTSDGIVEVGRLVVDGGWLRCGVGMALMALLEDEHSHAQKFRLFTGEEATAPLALYSKRGYQPTHIDDSGPVTLVWLEKPILRTNAP